MSYNLFVELVEGRAQNVDKLKVNGIELYGEYGSNDQTPNAHRHHSIRKTNAHSTSTIHRSSKYAFNLSIKLGRFAFWLDDASA